MARFREINRSFTAMNTGIEIVGCVLDAGQSAGEEMLDRGQAVFAETEMIISRFDPNSELSQLNHAAGSEFKASPVLFTVVKLAVEAAKHTGGIFDPTILPKLMAAGYDRSFEELSMPPDSSSIKTAGNYTWKDIRLDTRSSTIFMPRGCGLDLGGIGKGWTADRTARLFHDFAGYAIDAGGDIVLGGKMTDGSPWSVGVADPLQQRENITAVELSNLAICTSCSTRRTWQRGNVSGHHLIDPRSGEPAASPVISVTVIGKSAAAAEVVAKTALILGPDAGMSFIESQPETSGILVLRDTSVRRSTGFAEFEHAS